MRRHSVTIDAVIEHTTLFPKDVIISMGGKYSSSHHTIHRVLTEASAQLRVWKFYRWVIVSACLEVGLQPKSFLNIRSADDGE